MRAILFFILCFVFTSAFSQDIIHFKNGDSVRGKVTEQSKDYIKVIPETDSVNQPRTISKHLVKEIKLAAYVAEKTIVTRQIPGEDAKINQAPHQAEISKPGDLFIQADRNFKTGIAFQIASVAAFTLAPYLSRDIPISHNNPTREIDHTFRNGAYLLGGIFAIVGFGNQLAAWTNIRKAGEAMNQQKGLSYGIQGKGVGVSYKF